MTEKGMMGIIGRIREWLCRNTPDAYVHLVCPATGQLLATENTAPDWLSPDGVAIYTCAHCGATHRFLWGPPCPLYLSDEPTPHCDHVEWAAIKSDQ